MLDRKLREGEVDPKLALFCCAQNNQTESDRIPVHTKVGNARTAITKPRTAQHMPVT